MRIAVLSLFSLLLFSPLGQTLLAARPLPHRRPHRRQHRRQQCRQSSKAEISSPSTFMAS